MAAPKTLRDGTAESVLAFLIERETDECIEWPYGRINGYAGSGPRYFHSLVCEWTHGERPAGNEAAHSCGNRICVNPRHLRWATTSENQMDRRQHGTANTGSRHGMSRLNESQVREIRLLHSSGVTGSELSRRFNVSAPTISGVVNRKRWVHV
jgi:hypothetical protein